MTGLWDRVSVKVVDSPVTLLEPHVILDELHYLEEGDGNHADAAFTVSANLRGLADQESVDVRAELLDSDGSVLVSGQASTNNGNAVSVTLQVSLFRMWMQQEMCYLYLMLLYLISFMWSGAHN